MPHLTLLDTQLTHLLNLFPSKLNFTSSKYFRVSSLSLLFLEKLGLVTAIFKKISYLPKYALFTSLDQQMNPT